MSSLSLLAWAHGTVHTTRIRGGRGSSPHTPTGRQALLVKEEVRWKMKKDVVQERMHTSTEEVRTNTATKIRKVVGICDATSHL